MADGRSKTSANNGKKGGRPKGYAALQAEQSRVILCEQLEKEWLPIVQKAIEQAKSGDRSAREWLADRGYGRSLQAIELTGKDGANLFGDEETKNKTKQTTTAFLKGESKKGD